jgi:hypothetical protein
MPGRIAQQADNRCVEFAFLGKPIVQFPQLTPGGKLSKPEQVTSLFKIGVVGQFVYVDAAIGKNAAIPIDVADLGVGGDDSFESLRGVICGEARHEFLVSAKFAMQNRSEAATQRATFVYT